MQFVPKKLSPSQKQLLELAREPVRKTSVEIVRIHEAFTGVTYAARLACQQSRSDKAMPRNLTLLACKGWDVAMEMVKLAGPENYGYGHLDTMRRCLAALIEGDKRPLVLWFDRAGRMPVWEQEDLEARLETIAHDLGIAMRMVFLIQKVLVWDNAAQRRKRDWVLSGHLLRRAREWEYTAAGFDAALTDAEAEQAERAPAVKIA